MIKKHDINMAKFIDTLKSSNPSQTFILADPSIFYGYRQIMYYLPDFLVYNAELNINEAGERRKFFGGIQNRTFLTDAIIIPDNIREYARIMVTKPEIRKSPLKESKITHIFNGLYIVYGGKSDLHALYPRTPFKDEPLRNEPVADTARSSEFASQPL
jgi:hypothetical protein